jgi:ATP synthase proteolipid subunit
MELTRRGRRVLAFMVLMCIVGFYNYYLADRGLEVVVTETDNTVALNQGQADYRYATFGGHHHTLDGEDPPADPPDPEGTNIIQPETPAPLSHMTLPPLTNTRAIPPHPPPPGPLGPGLLLDDGDGDGNGKASQWDGDGNYTGRVTITNGSDTINSLEIRREHVKLACGPHAPLFGFVGVIVAVGAPCLGVAYAVSKLSIAIATVGTTCLQPDLMTRSILPVVMAELLAIYGLIVAIIIISNREHFLKLAFFNMCNALTKSLLLRCTYFAVSNAAPNASFTRYPTFNGYAHMCAGFCVGLSGLASAVTIGKTSSPNAARYLYPCLSNIR